MEQTNRVDLKVGSKLIILETDSYQDVSGVGDSSNDSCGNHELLPCLSKVDDVNSFLVAFVHVWVHQVGAVLSSEVNL